MFEKRIALTHYGLSEVVSNAWISAMEVGIENPFRYHGQLVSFYCDGIYLSDSLGFTIGIGDHNFTLFNDRSGPAYNV